VVPECALGPVDMTENEIAVLRNHGELALYSLQEANLGQCLDVLPLPSAPVTLSFNANFLLVVFSSKASVSVFIL